MVFTFLVINPVDYSNWASGLHNPVAQAYWQHNKSTVDNTNAMKKHSKRLTSDPVPNQIQVYTVFSNWGMVFTLTKPFCLHIVWLLLLTSFFHNEEAPNNLPSHRIHSPFNHTLLTVFQCIIHGYIYKRGACKSNRAPAEGETKLEPKETGEH